MAEASTQQTESTSAATGTTGQDTQDVLDQLLKPEVQQSLAVLVENLPKLAEMTTMLTKTYDLAQTVMSDRVLINDLKGGVQEFVQPIQQKTKQIAAAAMEANERARMENSTIGLFGMLRMLKDPQVQQFLRFAQGFLDVMAEKQQQQSKPE